MTHIPVSLRGPLAGLFCLLVAGVLLAGCAAGRAVRQGDEAAVNGDWDAAVAYYRRAVEEDPDKPDYRIALERAMLNASRVHMAAARDLESRNELAAALVEYRKASEFDPSNGQAMTKLASIQRTIRDQIEASRPRPAIEAMREQARLETQPPLLNPADDEPLGIGFTDASLSDILDFLGNATGINVTYDQQFQDRSYTVQLDGVTVEEALDQILTANQYFYKVLNPRTIMIIPETPQKRAQYEEQVIRTFYISHADVAEVAQLLSQIVRVPQMAVQPQIVPNAVANTITIRATTAVAAVIEQVISSNDKPRAEIVMDVEILEVNRERARQYGLDLTQYAVGALFSPEVAPAGEAVAPDNPALSPPFNVNTISQGISPADFYMAVPAAVVRFLETDSQTRLVAKPQLRGMEGTQLTLNLGDDIPVPATAFTAIATGGASVNPLTSFNYRPVGVIVEMTPRVTYEGEIILDLTVENSTLGPNITIAGSALPTFGSRRVVTRLRLRDGESNLLAGLLREEDRRSLRGFPGIMHLPIIKQLFSSNEDSVKQTDIVMLLTPRIVRTHELTQADISPIHIGTQRNIGLSGPPPLIATPPAGSGGGPPAPVTPPTLDPDTQAPAPEPAPVDTPTPPVLEPQPDPAQAILDLLESPDAALVTTDPTLPPAVAEPAVGGTVIVTPPGLELLVGAGPYTVPISISGVSQLSTLTLSLGFDPTLLRVSTVQEGSFMRQGTAEVTFTQQVDGTSGRIDLTLTRMGDLTGASGSGLLAAVVFEAIAPGTTALTPNGLGLTPQGAPLFLTFTPVTVTTR